MVLYMSVFLVIYAYHETEDSKKNLDFFLRHAVFDLPDIDYIIVSQTAFPTVEIPNFSNVKLIKKDKNEGLDFGAWSVGLREVELGKYEKFIFLNDTVRGPFFPPFVKDDLIGRWYQIFCRKLNERIKLVGVTVNNMTSFRMLSRHVQSMAFCTDSVGLRLLLAAGLFDYKACVRLSKDKEIFVEKREIYMSEIILKNKFEIDELYVRESQIDDDIHFLDNGDRRLNPLEVMFIKTNRIDSPELREYTNWYDSTVS